MKHKEDKSNVKGYNSVLIFVIAVLVFYLVVFGKDCPDCINNPDTCVASDVATYSKLQVYQVADDPLFVAKCFDNYNWDPKIILIANFSSFWQTGNVLEYEDQNTIIKYPQLRYDEIFDVNEFDMPGMSFHCRLDSSFEAEFEEYIDGVLVDKKQQSRCDFFWNDMTFDLYCDENCNIEKESELFNEFMKNPENLLYHECFESGY